MSGTRLERAAAMRDPGQRAGTRRTLALLAVGLSLTMLGSVLLVSTGGTVARTGAGSSGLVVATGASITVSPTSSGASKSVTVTGAGFPVGTTANLTLITSLVPKFNLTGSPYPYNKPTAVTVNSTGGFVWLLSLIDINAGHYEIQATDGSATATAAIRVTGTHGGLTFTISTSTVLQGGCVVLKGSDFYPMDFENFYIGPWKGSLGFKQLKGFDDNLTGGFKHKWTVPSSFAPGSYALIVVGDTYGTGVADLTITSGTGTAC